MIFYQEKIAELKREIDQRLTEVDALISAQLNEILHHPEFQALEANWRGLHYLVRESRPGLRLKIKLLHAPKRDLLKDFEHAPEIENSSLFGKINGEHDFFFGMLIGADAFSGDPRDLTLLEYLSKLGMMVHIPFISTVSSGFFEGADSSRVIIQDTLNWSTLYSRPENYRWHRLRESESSKYLGICLPRILLRHPHNVDGSFKFQETKALETLLWGSAAFAFAACVARGFNETGWFSKFGGMDSAGRVENLPTHGFFSGDGTDDDKISLDAIIEEEQAAELSKLGFIPLLQPSSMSHPIFYSNQSVCSPRRYDTDLANARALIAAQLSNILAASRFAHYLMSMWCDAAAPLTNGKEIEIKLNRWISNYCDAWNLRFTPLSDLDEETAARYPLREFRIDVCELPDQPGRFKLLLWIRPFYLLEDVGLEMRLEIYPEFGRRTSR